MKRVPIKWQSTRQAKRERELGLLRSYIAIESGCLIGCEVPGCRGFWTDAHHILERSRGGKDNAGNLLLCCRSCHESFKTVHPVITDEEAFKIVSKRNEYYGIEPGLTGIDLIGGKT